MDGDAVMGPDARASSPPPSDGARDSPANPRGDFRDALAWMALGIAIFIGSVTMDRLADQDPIRSEAGLDLLDRQHLVHGTLPSG